MLSRDGIQLRVMCLTLIGSILLMIIPIDAVSQTDNMVVIPAGTAVQVTFPQALGTKELTEGQILNLLTAAAVAIDGKIVIEEGALVTAEVVRLKKPGAIGSPGEIAVAFRFAVALDGTKVALTGQETREGESNVTEALVITIICCILGLLMKGGDVTIPAGSIVNTYTLTNSSVAL